MLNKFSSIGMLVAGIFIGWVAHERVLPSATHQPKNIEETKNIPSAEEISISFDLPKSEIPSIQLDYKFLSNPQLDKLLELFKFEMDASAQETLDLQLLQYARKITSAPRKYRNVEKQLVNLAGIETIEVEILPLLITYYENQQRNELAIEQLYKLRSLLSLDSDFNRLSKQINKLTAKEIKHLAHSRQKEELTRFYEKLIEIEPDNYGLQMQFALFEYENRHYDKVVRLLSVLVYHADLGDEASKLLQRTQYQLDRQASDDLPIPVENREGQYIVSAVINDLEPVKLLLDTGASMTILSPEIINSLGIVAGQQTLRFSTANGEVYAPIVMVDKIDIQNYMAREVRVGVLPSFPMGTVDGLLGMNFLRHFSFFIDQENQVLHLSRIESQ